MHPLHDDRFIAALHRDATGDLRRRTGRSTAKAMQLLSDAILNPGKMIVINDHDIPDGHRSRYARASDVRRMMQDMVKVLGLEHMQFTDQTVTFKRK